MNTETRSITLVDLPTLRRLSGHGVVLDSDMSVTQETYAAHSASLVSMLLNRGMYTLLARNAHDELIGQFRYRQDDLNAHMVYLAPEGVNDTSVILHLLDAMTREAGKLGAHALIAEVNAESALFEALRTARFACYMRQTLWRHDPVHAQETVPLTEESGNDQIGIMSLICHTIPTLQQAVTAPTPDMQGLVYRRDGHVEAYIAYSEGKQGVYLLPFIHPDVLPQARDILTSAVAKIARSSRVPITVNVRSYQAWLGDVLRDMNFAPIAEQAVMVRHIAAIVRYAPLRRLQGKLETAVNVAPPSWSSARPYDED
mgnify:CR=1 FL=1